MPSLPHAYALIIGVGNDLPVTVRDAQAIRNLLADDNYAGYDTNNIILLTENSANRENILAAFDHLIAHADNDSSVLLFYSGHGGTYHDNDILLPEDQKPDHENHQHFYLLPHNFDPERFDETWVTAEEVKDKIRQIKSRRLVFFLDCCHAAGMTKSANFRTEHTPKNKLTQPEAMAQRIDDGQGISIISSCREDQQSYILDGDLNSLFTKCLIEVLKGKHKDYFQEPFIRITEITQYLFRRIPELISNQKPYVNLQVYDDFILSRVPKALYAQQPPSIIVEDQQPASQPKEVKTVFRQSDGANSVILFVHGFTGEAFNSFGQTPELIMNDKEFNGWDLFPVGYTPNINPSIGNQVWASREDVDIMTDYLSTLLKTKFHRYSRIAIMAHGLGGIVCQMAILNLDHDLRQRISHLLLFGSPNSGLSEKLIETTDKERLSFLNESGTFIRELRQNWEATFSGKYPFAMHVISATEDEYIPANSSLGAFDQAYHTILRGNHFSMIKPEKHTDEPYVFMSTALLNNKFLHQITTAEEINITLGEYRAVVQTLLPKVDQLDYNGIKNLCLALEGLDREDEALSILKNHQNIEEEGEIISLLGGRFKRLYLKEFEQKHGENAYSLYEKALTLASDKGDARSIYYNAINLAFLSVVFKRNLQKMQSYSKTASEALALDPFPSLWKIATEGECALYEANFDLAKEKYAEASKQADVRQKLSIYTNAYTAYTTLMNTKSSNDPFITFLTNTFL